MSKAGSTGARGARRTFAPRGRLTWPERSIFGARLRRRWPQYGHAVMYGDPSELQFLQMTKRSGSVDTLAPDCLRYAAPRLRLARGRGHDLGHDLAEVVVGFVDHDLARCAIAAIDQVLDALELGSRTEVFGMTTQPVHQALGQGARAHAVRVGQVDQLAVEAVAGRQPLVLVEHLPRVVGQVLARLVVLGELLDHRLDQRGQRQRVLDARLAVHRADLDRAELRVRADVVPEGRVVLDHTGVDHELDLELVVV